MTIRRSPAQVTTRLVAEPSEEPTRRLWVADPSVDHPDVRRLVLENTRDMVTVLDRDGRVVYASPSHSTVLGYRPEELVGSMVFDLVHPDDLENTLKNVGAAVVEDRAFVSEVRLRHRDEHWVLVEAAGTRVPGDEGEASQLLVCSREIAERTLAEERIREAEQRYRTLLERLPAVVYAEGVDPNRTGLYLSPQIEALTGYSPEELLASPQLWRDLIHRGDRERIHADRVRAAASGAPMVTEYRLMSRDGRTVWVRDETVVVRAEDGQPRFRQGILQDISDRKDAEEQVAFLAYHDGLTHLPNRALFEELLELDLARARRNGRSVALLYIDLDNFKLVNDSLGHDAGDELLCQVADRLGRVSRDSDLVARLGGDEFLLLLSDIEMRRSAQGPPDPAQVAQRVAARIQDALSKPFTLAGAEFYDSASIGISLFPADASDGRSLLKNADAAMYRTKRTGPGGVSVFSRTIDVHRKLSLTTRLRKAVNLERWVLHYQPIVDLDRGGIVGVEALVRWFEPGLGLMPPGEFIPLAEEMGLIESIGDWVVMELGRQCRRWKQRGLSLELSFNLSPRLLWHSGLAERVMEPLVEAGCDPTSVVIEITETSAMADPDRTYAFMTALREDGVRFAIDDFGTGYSSLSRLRDLPVDILKIDRSFVRDLPRSPDAAALARGIIQLAGSLGMTPLAEGIETDAQRQFLLAEGCHLGQGYYFSYPVPGDDIPDGPVLTTTSAA